MAQELTFQDLNRFQWTNQKKSELVKSLKLPSLTVVVEVEVCLCMRVSHDSIVLERIKQLRLTTNLEDSVYFAFLSLLWST